jgi:uncharacterized repeat protein (TIGR03806 family)
MMTSFVNTLIFACGLFGLFPSEPDLQWPLTLSEWQLFKHPLADLNPTSGVLPYTVNAPLYSDYAYKSRYIKIPDGTAATFTDHAFDMPHGTVLIKNFYYLNDERQPRKGRHILETRFIVRDGDKWHAVAYQWNQVQTDAFRAIAGGSADISWTDKKGKQRQLHYLIPDANQCKNCHNKNDQLLPLGITARQLNGPKEDNQLLRWQDNHMLTGLPEDLKMIPQLVDYEMDHLPLDVRARSYLDANCGHCHSSHGSARTSGLNLDYDETDPHALGVMKPPVAAGRGSGGMQFSIVPGKPNQSILLYRMESNDPGIRMPEINRQIPHEEGIELIREWIRNIE